MKRKALGKGLGLSALVPNKSDEKGTVLDLGIDLIVPNRHQPRKSFSQDALKSLAASLKQHGLMQPVLIREEENGRHELISGERRWRAAQMAGFKKIPAIVKQVNDQELMEWAVLENIQREDLNPIEKAKAYSRLSAQFSLTQEAIALRMGIDRSSVANFLRLLQLPVELWEEVAENRLSMGHAKALLSLGEKDAQILLAEEIKSKGMSVRQAENAVQKIKKEISTKPGKTPPAIDANMTMVEDRLRHSLGTKVRLIQQGTGGEIRISYYAVGDLERILEKLT